MISMHMVLLGYSGLAMQLRKGTSEALGDDSRNSNACTDAARQARVI